MGRRRRAFQCLLRRHLQLPRAELAASKRGPHCSAAIDRSDHRSVDHERRRPWKSGYWVFASPVICDQLVDRLLVGQALVGSWRLARRARPPIPGSPASFAISTNSWSGGRFSIASSWSCGVALRPCLPFGLVLVEGARSGKKLLGPLQRAISDGGKVDRVADIVAEFPADLARSSHICRSGSERPSRRNARQCGQVSDPYSTSFTFALGLPITKPPAGVALTTSVQSAGVGRPRDAACVAARAAFAGLDCMRRERTATAQARKMRTFIDSLRSLDHRDRLVALVERRRAAASRNSAPQATPGMREARDRQSREALRRAPWAPAEAADARASAAPPAACPA